MSLQVRQNYVLFYGKNAYLLKGAQTRKSGGNIGALKCNENSVQVKPLMAVWSGKFPTSEISCGGNRDMHSMYDVVAPGCTDGSALMIDDWTYVTQINFP